MKNMKIGKKILFTFSVVFLVTLILCITSITGLRYVSNQFSVFYEKPYVISTETMNMRRVIAGSERAILLACSAKGTENIQNAIDQSDRFMQELGVSIEVLNEKFSEHKAQIDEFTTYLQSTTATKTQISDLALAGKNGEAFQTYAKKYLPMMDVARGQLEALGTTADDSAAQFYQSARNAGRTANIASFALCIIALAIIVYFSFHLTRLLVRPLTELEEVASQLVAGKLDVSIAYQSKDELGSLAEKMRNLSAHLQAIIADQTRLLGEIAIGNLNVRSEAEEDYVGDFQALLASL